MQCNKFVLLLLCISAFLASCSKDSGVNSTPSEKPSITVSDATVMRQNSATTMRFVVDLSVAAAGKPAWIIRQSQARPKLALISRRPRGR